MVVEETRGFMINLKRTIAVATTAGLFALAGISGAQAAEPTTPVVKRVALTPEQKAAFTAAHDAFKAAVATARAGIPAKPVKPVRP